VHALTQSLSRLTHAQVLTPCLPVVSITTMRSIDVIKMLEADGWMLRGVRGSHHVFKHSAKPGHVTVPHPKKDLGTGLTHKLLKQAGLK